MIISQKTYSIRQVVTPQNKVYEFLSTVAKTEMEDKQTRQLISKPVSPGTKAGECEPNLDAQHCL